jgi:hypothetical protein
MPELPDPKKNMILVGKFLFERKEGACVASPLPIKQPYLIQKAPG